jgi:hypothetical protein
MSEQPRALLLTLTPQIRPKNCSGTHKMIAAVKADISEELEANGFPHAAGT